MISINILVLTNIYLVLQYFAVIDKSQDYREKIVFLACVLLSPLYFLQQTCNVVLMDGNVYIHTIWGHQLLQNHRLGPQVIGTVL